MSDSVAPVIRSAQSAADLDEVRALFRDYERSQDQSPCFVGFQAELDGLPGVYAGPEGALLLAVVDGQSAGVVGVRPLGDGTAELRRLFVRPAFRRGRIGRALAEAALAAAKAGGQRALRLETLTSMEAARTLYESLGFREVAPYVTKPLCGAHYYERAV